MTRQLQSLSPGQFSSYYLGLCLFHRLISDRLEGMEGMEGLRWLLQATPPEGALFTTSLLRQTLREVSRALTASLIKGLSLKCSGTCGSY